MNSTRGNNSLTDTAKVKEEAKGGVKGAIAIHYEHPTEDVPFASMITIAAEQLHDVGFWGGVGLAAAIATALSTAASTATAIWWRYQDRTEAEWSIRLVRRGGQDGVGNRVAAPKVAVIFQNIGDGTAHQVRISGEHLSREPWTGSVENAAGHGQLEIHQPIPLLRTGDSISVTANAESFDVWDKASIQISWWPPPTRKKKDWGVRSRQQIRRFRLADITPPPSDLPEVRKGHHVF
ncbi:hypothetical protein PP633_06170 [Mycobacteroides abscessus]|uniref:hypothetical protein n=1 Tax=Mycobacteroides abscessus TaxID=36809 RepID=UPI000698C3F1|nr:hypothetical protein [Mycobacteroides abscessus]MDM2642453.1 hypothetical protein [Mycobacteroides abscessus]MDM2652254.1 hypothetical protein [Mycobacteroides abscessus]MDM2662839.1 hypothetical protein [Mycobacteroides abscessus]MDM2667947.1 hypothetical protein [Mycobacteroides abscessus]MDM2673349.1 hypothetical protein [Mycobacteroides abscessus]